MSDTPAIILVNSRGILSLPQGRERYNSSACNACCRYCHVQRTCCDWTNCINLTVTSTIHPRTCLAVPPPQPASAYAPKALRGLHVDTAGCFILSELCRARGRGAACGHCSGELQWLLPWKAGLCCAAVVEWSYNSSDAALSPFSSHPNTVSGASSTTDVTGYDVFSSLWFPEAGEVGSFSIVHSHFFPAA